MNSGVRWCSSVGTMSSTRILPSVAAPPACSTMNASGLASYSSRSLPFGFFVFGGYAKMPPPRRLRWKSATSEPT